MPEKFYLGHYVADLLPMLKGNITLGDGILGAAFCLMFGTLFVFMARYAERWDAVRKREQQMHKELEDAITSLNEVLNNSGCFRYTHVRTLLGTFLVPLARTLAQIELPKKITSGAEAEAVVHRQWHNLPRRLAACFATLQRDDTTSLAVFYVKLSRVLYSVQNALQLDELKRQPHAAEALDLIGKKDGMLDKLVWFANESDFDAQRVSNGDAFVPWRHITSTLSPGTALKKGLPVSTVHSIYLKIPSLAGIEYRAKVDVVAQEQPS